MVFLWFLVIISLRESLLLKNTSVFLSCKNPYPKIISPCSSNTARTSVLYKTTSWNVLAWLRSPSVNSGSNEQENIDPKELLEMAQESGGQLELACDFCNKKEIYTEQDTMKALRKPG